VILLVLWRLLAFAGIIAAILQWNVSRDSAIMLVLLAVYARVSAIPHEIRTDKSRLAPRT
jgi:hypothetical protein